MAIAHVLPINDVKEHEESIACPCRPRVEAVEGGRVIIHNAWDGREIFENAVDQVSLS